MRNWGSRTNRSTFNQAVPNKRRGMFIWGWAGLFFVKIAPIFIIILAFLFNGIIPISHQARAKETGTIPSPIGKDVSVGPGQVFLICSSFLRPLPVLERNGGLSKLATRGGEPGMARYNRAWRQRYNTEGDNTSIVLRNGGPILVTGLSEKGKLIGEGIEVRAGDGVEVRIGALPRSIAHDKMPPLRAAAAEIIGGGLLSPPVLYSVRKGRAESSI